MSMWYNKVDTNRGKDVKKHYPVKNGAMPLIFRPPQERGRRCRSISGPFRFSLRKETRDYKT